MGENSSVSDNESTIGIEPKDDTHDIISDVTLDTESTTPIYDSKAVEDYINKTYNSGINTNNPKKKSFIDIVSLPFAVFVNIFYGTMFFYAVPETARIFTVLYVIYFISYVVLSIQTKKVRYVMYALISMVIGFFAVIFTIFMICGQILFSGL